MSQDRETTNLRLMRITYSPALIAHIKRNSTLYRQMGDNHVVEALSSKFWEAVAPLFHGSARPAGNCRAIMVEAGHGSSLGHDVYVELDGPCPEVDWVEAVIELMLQDELLKMVPGVGDAHVIARIIDSGPSPTPAPVD